MTKVKVCGITCMEDAQMAVQSGANAIGFLFAPSPRQIKPEKAREIIDGIAPFVKTVGVFVNEEPDVVRRITALCGLDLVQFHGEESPRTCEAFMPRVIKAFRVRDVSVLSSIRQYQGNIRAVLLDAFSHERAGGTGQTFDWDIAVKAKNLCIPVILSGGLNPGNIGNAVSKVRPFAVDVNSGIEERPGKKSSVLLAKLMKGMRDAENGRDTDE